MRHSGRQVPGDMSTPSSSATQGGALSGAVTSRLVAAAELVAGRLLLGTHASGGSAGHPVQLAPWESRVLLAEAA